MLNLNCTILAAVVEQALADAADHPRWVNAIRRAFEEVDSNPYLERAEHGGLLIGSSSGSVYAANGVCQCEAYRHGRPCWHRAAARLVRRHDEREREGRQIVCQQPDNICSVHEPCAEHEKAAAAYLGQDAQRITRKIAAQRATALVNELF